MSRGDEHIDLIGWQLEACFDGFERGRSLRSQLMERESGEEQFHVAAIPLPWQTLPQQHALLFPSLEMAWRDVDSSFERFCLTAGIGAVEQMLREDGQQLTGAPHSRGGGRVGHRWGTTEGKIGFHSGKVTVHRPRVRSFDGHEVALPSWTAAQAEGLAAGP